MTGSDDPFIEEEGKRAIGEMPTNKAPNPDGFTDAFLERCWASIKDDVMQVFRLFGDLHSENFHWLNSANTPFCPRKMGRRRFRAT